MSSRKATNSATGINDAIKEMHHDDFKRAVTLCRNSTMEERLGWAMTMTRINESMFNSGKLQAFTGNEIRMISGFHPCVGLGSVFGLNPKAAIMEMKAREDSKKSRKSEKKA